NTRLPSVTGEGDAGPFGPSSRPFCARGTSRRHSSRPLARSSARTYSLSLSCAVMKMWVAVSTGDECPAGTAVFQMTFFDGPNSAGSPEVADTPVPLGPRKRDQSDGFAAAVTAAGSESAATARLSARVIRRAVRSIALLYTGVPDGFDTKRDEAHES